MVQEEIDVAHADNRNYACVMLGCQAGDTPVYVQQRLERISELYRKVGGGGRLSRQMIASVVADFLRYGEMDES